MVKSLLSMLTFFILYFIGSSNSIAEGLDTPSFPVPWQLNLQNPATPVAEQLVEFHNFLLIIITIIVNSIFNISIIN